MSPKVVKRRFIYSTVHTLDIFLHNIKRYSNTQMLRNFIKYFYSLWFWETSKNVKKTLFSQASKFLETSGRKVKLPIESVAHLKVH